MRTLTRILLKSAFNRSDGPESNTKQERKEGKGLRKKQLNILIFFISSTFEMVFE